VGRHGVGDGALREQNFLRHGAFEVEQGRGRAHPGIRRDGQNCRKEEGETPRSQYSGPLNRPEATYTTTNYSSVQVT